MTVPDPIALAQSWLDAAARAGAPMPEAMALATANEQGHPSVRMVLMRGLDQEGFRFYTNRESRKGSELSENPRAALVFHWGPPLRRQARAEGIVAALTAEESAAYFETRARESRLGAWASPQSRPLADRTELDALLAAAVERFGDAPVPLPPFWGGYRLVPEAIELWRNRPNRLHDRARYERSRDGWTCVRLAP